MKKYQELRKSEYITNLIDELSFNRVNRNMISAVNELASKRSVPHDIETETVVKLVTMRGEYY